MIGKHLLIDFETFHDGKRVAYHSVQPIAARLPGRDPRRSKMHVTNVRRNQREAKRAFAGMFE